MDRETKKLTLELGGEVVLNTYLTGGEIMDLENVVAGSGRMTIEGKNGSMSMNPAEAMTKRLKSLIEFVVVSIAGETDKEKIWSAIRALRGNEYHVLMKEVDHVAEGLTAEDAKK